MARRSRGEQAEHDRVVCLVAQQRFPRETCRVVTNPGDERNHGLTYATTTGSRRTVYPDIVAVLEPGAKVVAVGEVETQSTVTRAALRHWRTFARHARQFYLFVPLERAQVAKQLVEGIENVRLRMYCCGPRESIVVNDV